MNRFHRSFKLSMWLMTAVLAAGVAGCGGGDGDAGFPGTGGTPTSAGVGKGVAGAGRGPAPVNLGEAGNLVILAESGISTTGATAVTGDLGLSPAAATSITGFSLVLDGLGQFSTSSLVTGDIFAADYAPPTPVDLTTAIGDKGIAYTNANSRAPDYTELGTGNIGD